ncbi:hypothetical protein CNEO2_10125 [Clostridium neonatale]|nr:hypothetical protein CNEO2_10125 [Clostridium neonatale]
MIVFFVNVKICTPHFETKIKISYFNTMNSIRYNILYKKIKGIYKVLCLIKKAFHLHQCLLNLCDLWDIHLNQQLLI